MFIRNIYNHLNVEALEDEKVLKFSYGNVTFKEFSEEYEATPPRAAEKFGRKISAPPRILYAIIAGIVHLAIAILIGIPKAICDRGIFLKKHIFCFLRQGQAAFGRLVMIFHDCYGNFHTQESLFHLRAYSEIAKYPQKKEPEPEKPKAGEDPLKDRISEQDKTHFESAKSMIENGDPNSAVESVDGITDIQLKIAIIKAAIEKFVEWKQQDKALGVVDKIFDVVEKIDDRKAKIELLLQVMMIPITKPGSAPLNDKTVNNKAKLSTKVLTTIFRLKLPEGTTFDTKSYRSFVIAIGPLVNGNMPLNVIIDKINSFFNEMRQ